MEEPATAVTVPLGQDPDRALGVETTNPAGRLSTNPTAFLVDELLFETVNARDVVPFTGMVDAPKLFTTTGGSVTVNAAFDTALIPPSLEFSWTELFLTPPVVPTTLTEKTHPVPAPKVPPARLTLLEPATLVTVPPQDEPTKLTGVDTTKPAGKLSVKASPVKGARPGL